MPEKETLRQKQNSEILRSYMGANNIERTPTT